MALTLDASVGGVNSNSYLTEAEGTTYHESHLYSADYDDATTLDKEAALVWATRLLDDAMIWEGSLTDIALPQALDWPRQGVVDKEFRTIDFDIVPQAVKNATAELARLLIAADRTADRDTIGFKKISVGSLSLEIDKLDELKVIPDSVYDLIQDLGVRKSRVGSVLLERV